MSNEYKIITDTKKSLNKICEGTIELDWSSATCNLEEENLILGMIVGHETYVKKVLSYLPETFIKELVADLQPVSEEKVITNSSTFL